MFKNCIVQTSILLFSSQLEKAVRLKLILKIILVCVSAFTFCGCPQIRSFYLKRWIKLFQFHSKAKVDGRFKLRIFDLNVDDNRTMPKMNRVAYVNKAWGYLLVSVIPFCLVPLLVWQSCTLALGKLDSGNVL